MYSYEAMKLYLSNQSPGTVLNTRKDSDGGGGGGDRDVSMTHKMLAAGFAGSFTWFALFPIDVIKTRIQAEICGLTGRQHLLSILRQGSSSSSSSSSCCNKSVSDHMNIRGKVQVVRQLYRGCFYAVIRAAPVAASILPLYEFLNEALLRRL